ncbi:MAG: helix-turn-helix domain-containing protein [Methanothrix sp.]|uniref:ArsR/SmtB family transcription factor n=1 Tax=Methanothrix sp. TaxID=90426 RepID=UPI00247CEAAE|nr:helix-turn-helix domain-containing protein [Methanothrix sp.]
MCRYPDLLGPLQRIQRYIRAMHCPTRWAIIRCIGEGERSTKEIYKELSSYGEISMPGLYYHLSALREAGIIEAAGYRESGGGIPEKVWRLRTRRIVIDLLDETEVE